jgi:hypothetical protein
MISTERICDIMINLFIPLRYFFVEEQQWFYCKWCTVADDVIDMLTNCEAMKDLSSSLFTSMETLISHVNSRKKGDECDKKDVFDNGFSDELQDHVT